MEIQGQFMNGKRSELFSLARLVLQVISMVTFLCLTCVFVSGALTKPYGFEGIYNSVAPLEVIGPIGENHDDQPASDDIVLAGMRWHRASKMESIVPLFGIWGITGTILIASWWRRRTQEK